ncbi:MAG: enoyl ACP reductase FabMG family protein [Pseudobdellovibrionaceae bacterium]
MTAFQALRNKPTLSPYKKGDILVLFGELFSRGYANGLVEEAERLGMTIVRATVGRREKDGSLRPLNAEESQNIPQPFINIPLEAGFDLEPDDSGKAPVDYLKDIRLTDWQSAVISSASVEQSRKKGEQRFRRQVQNFLSALESHIPAGAKVVFAHLMAGGVPRAKIIMPLMNRAFKGTGERYLESRSFWESSIGQLCSTSFNEVTAETLRHLLELSKPLREKITAQGGHVSYIGYGYHGTEVLYGNIYQWQTYAPYLQGWAKIKLENIAKKALSEGIACCIYNCPEILTNSSSIFQGVEVSLYPLLGALKKEVGHVPEVQKILQECQSRLKPDITFESILSQTEKFIQSDVIKKHSVYEQWPQHSSAEQLQTMLEYSDYLVSLHTDEKNLITGALSEAVFKSCGYVMLHDSFAPKYGTAWIGHDLVAKCFEK